MYNFIKTSVENAIFTIILNRPEKRNAFTPTMVNEIAHAVSIANANESVKLIVFKAEGPVFCAGMDLNVFKNHSLDTFNPAIKQENISLGKVMEKLQKPSIALLEGDVIAGGFLLIANCTYVFSSKNVRFRLPELEIGIFPFQVMASLLNIMPKKQMIQLCLETDYFSVDKAIEVGLVDGYLEDIDLNTIYKRFMNFDSKALMAGLFAAKELAHIKKEDHYDFLLKSLHKLKKQTNFK
ncbi:enoyl-CoA hydratase/isomerase family protein [Sphingobacterium sp. UT-1RO-CII-1]|uniref:enoyl-CoA hydratase/isomerase family protein n=1 Tax=Sphingobacterium sp. UT-1RO-CII-1 TaxID=2995225 RepID=UPI00227CB29E|nr:enoyl-CoA hydratase/isomerase family protein [Sphingobacterium sp. UT-1RO-CII-1]MCY4778717.1 enoyl-CoA hydratase/isomerase family protein [Sphingobacterium sp. UT-1RO-CII-1]